MSQVDVAAKNVQFFFIQFDEEILAVRISWNVIINTMILIIIMKTVFTNTKMNVKMGWMCKLSLVSVSHIRLITYIVKYGTGSDPKNSIIKVIIECKNYDEFDTT